MAEIEYTRGADNASTGGAFGRAVSLVGAVVSVGLVIGIGVWGYRLVMRDVSGIPVVRALAGPMRVQPDDPGGSQADHQGLAVNTVAAKGMAAAPAERLMLAPRPITLADEDAPMGAAAPALATASNTQTTQQEGGSLAALIDPPADAQGEAMARITPAALQAAVAGRPGIMAAVLVPDPKPAATPAVAIVTGPGVIRSLRPHLRPVRAAVTGTALEPVPVSLDVDPDSLPVGTRLAQLGAFASADIARAQWVLLSGRFNEYFDGKKRVIQMASSGGRTFYRLRAMGFEDISAARRFCAVLVAGNADCIPVPTR